MPRVMRRVSLTSQNLSARESDSTRSFRLHFLEILDQTRCGHKVTGRMTSDRTVGFSNQVVSDKFILRSRCAIFWSM